MNEIDDNFRVEPTSSTECDLLPHGEGARLRTRIAELEAEIDNYRNHEARYLQRDIRLMGEHVDALETVLARLVEECEGDYECRNGMISALDAAREALGE